MKLHWGDVDQPSIGGFGKGQILTFLPSKAICSETGEKADLVESFERSFFKVAAR